jgi:purine-cytosine permease-like protein
MKSLAPFIVMIAILITIASIIIVLSNYTLKRRIIDKGPLDEHSLKFLEKLTGAGSEILKWGIIILFGGIGLVVLEFVPFDANISPLPYGIEAIFIALGFLLYYYLVQRKSNSLPPQK